MKRSIIIICSWLSFAAQGQVEVLDSLQQALTRAKTEEKKIDILNEISFRYNTVSIEKSREVAEQALHLANTAHYPKGVADAYDNLGICFSLRGTYDKGLNFFLQALKIRNELNDLEGAAKIMNNLAGIFMYQKEFDKAIEYSDRSLAAVKKLNNKLAIGNALLAHGMIYEGKNDTSKAFDFLRQALALFEKTGDKKKQGEVLIAIGGLQEVNQKHQLALETCFRAMDLTDVKSDYIRAIVLFQNIGEIYSGLGNDKTARHYLHLALQLANQTKSVQEQMSSRLKLSEFFQKAHRYDSALYYYQDYARLSQDTYSKEMASQLAMLENVYEMEKKDNLIQGHQQKIRSQGWIISAISVVLILITILGSIVYRFYRQKGKANIQLSELNKVVSETNQKITAQSEELMKANEEIRRINENLEGEVNSRTERIKTQNEKLIEYAFFNAHKVRGPVARLLGLAMLLGKDMTFEEMKEINKKVEITAVELDQVIKEINKKLEME